MTIGSNIIFYDTLPSTNTEASLLLKEKELPEGTVIMADFQTEGKGQPGYRWESEKGKNLLISIILYPESVAPDEQFQISMTISLGLCDFIGRYFNGSRIKWPNDIYINDDKIAGILIENSILGNKIESSVAGIGFNINQDRFEPGIPNPVSLKMITGVDHDTHTCLKQMLLDLDRRYKQLLYGDRKIMTHEYTSLLYRSGEWHKYKSSNTLFEGKILGISASGKLLLRIGNDQIREFSFKEVDYIQ
jgi:BirA family biotin operon repressor/biotin-[acetyl-CoA-carboxylase] ligase